LKVRNAPDERSPDVEVWMVSSQTEMQPRIVSVLIVASNPGIEALIGELVAFAGYRPIFDVTAGAAGETIRRCRPDVTVLDLALRASVVTACIGAADEVASALVLTSNTASADELAADARAQQRAWFALPASPTPLARAVERALAAKSRAPVVALPMRRQHPVHPALRAALAAVARARALSLRVAATSSLAFGSAASQVVLAETGARAALRAAVTDYTKQLKSERVPVEGILRRVRDAIADCATVVGADAATPMLLIESDDWARAAYHGG
jgi:hypothetical protein